MFDFIDNNIVDNLFKLKIELSALNLAIHNAKKMNLNRSEISPLFARKEKIQNDKKDIEFKALNGMVLENVINIYKNWYAIAYYSSLKNKKYGIRNLFVTPIKKEIDIKSIRNILNNNNNKLKQQSPIILLRNIRDMEALNNFKTLANKYSLLILDRLISNQDKTNNNKEDLFDFDFDIITNNDNNNNDDAIVITNHAYQRWCERIENVPNKDNSFIININDINYKKTIVPKIKESFKDAEKIYEKPESDTIFYLNKNDMIFFCLKSKTIIVSIWKNDFGFLDEINNKITLMQLDYVNKCNKLFFDSKKENINIINDINNSINLRNKELNDLLNMKNDLQKKIDNKKEEINFLNNNINNILEKEENDFNSLKNEEDKLFKKYSIEDNYIIDSVDDSMKKLELTNNCNGNHIIIEPICDIKLNELNDIVEQDDAGQCYLTLPDTKSVYSKNIIISDL